MSLPIGKVPAQSPSPSICNRHIDEHGRAYQYRTPVVDPYVPLSKRLQNEDIKVTGKGQDTSSQRILASPSPFTVTRNPTRLMLRISWTILKSRPRQIDSPEIEGQVLIVDDQCHVVSAPYRAGGSEHQSSGTGIRRGGLEVPLYSERFYASSEV
ncbi:hypothetical protein BDQ17DRAFT_1542325 [Cyathus striatus]|nr:hypothetical protein BDQ17DRAFT_1542325 [Cyathus striatus]